MRVRESTLGGYTINLTAEEGTGLIDDLVYLSSLGLSNQSLAPSLATSQLLDELTRVEEEVGVELARLADCN